MPAGSLPNAESRIKTSTSGLLCGSKAGRRKDLWTEFAADSGAKFGSRCGKSNPIIP